MGASGSFPSVSLGGLFAAFPAAGVLEIRPDDLHTRVLVLGIEPGPSYTGPPADCGSTLVIRYRSASCG